MDDGVAAFDERFDGWRVLKAAGEPDDVGRHVGAVASRAIPAAEAVAGGGEPRGDVAADESGCAGQGDLHGSTPLPHRMLSRARAATTGPRLPDGVKTAPI